MIFKHAQSKDLCQNEPRFPRSYTQNQKLGTGVIDLLWVMPFLKADYCLVLLTSLAFAGFSLPQCGREQTLNKQLNLDMNIWFHSSGCPPEKFSIEAASAQSVLPLSAIYWKTAQIRIPWSSAIEGIPFFSFLFFWYWSIVNLQCCISFRCEAQWFIYTHASIHSFSDSTSI